jgi:hypothetical protein
MIATEDTEGTESFLVMRVRALTDRCFCRPAAGILTV